jgi:hypothetical protein
MDRLTKLTAALSTAPYREGAPLDANCPGSSRAELALVLQFDKKRHAGDLEGASSDGREDSWRSRTTPAAFLACDRAGARTPADVPL